MGFSWTNDPMILSANMKEAARSLYSAKQRTVLALIGIVIGIGSVIAMVSVGKIVQREALRQFMEMGTNVLTIRKDPVVGGKAAETSIQMKDVFTLPSLCPTVSAVAPFTFGSGNIVYNGKKLDATNLVGATRSFSDINKLIVEKGRFLSDLDENSHFCVVGNGVAKNIMAMHSDVIGKKIKIDDDLFTIAGYLDDLPAGGLRSFDPNSSIYIHLTTFLRLHRDAQISNILARVTGGIQNAAAQAQVKEYFKRRTKTGEVNISSPEEIIAQMEQQMKLYTLLLGAIGSISLIVGGVGVMNVMLVSVAERRKEIGIRRALGAKRSDVKNQFLVESLILSLVGGLLGILLGVAASYTISFFAKWQFGISYPAILLGFGVSSAVGIFFGYYPAYQASKLDPIIALRSD